MTANERESKPVLGDHSRFPGGPAVRPRCRAAYAASFVPALERNREGTRMDANPNQFLASIRSSLADCCTPALPAGKRGSLRPRVGEEPRTNANGRESKPVLGDHSRFPGGPLYARAAGRLTRFPSSPCWRGTANGREWTRMDAFLREHSQFPGGLAVRPRCRAAYAVPFVPALERNREGTRTSANERIRWRRFAVPHPASACGRGRPPRKPPPERKERRPGCPGRRRVASVSGLVVGAFAPGEPPRASDRAGHLVELPVDLRERPVQRAVLDQHLAGPEADARAGALEAEVRPDREPAAEPALAQVRHQVLDELARLAVLARGAGADRHLEDSVADRHLQPHARHLLAVLVVRVEHVVRGVAARLAQELAVAARHLEVVLRLVDLHLLVVVVERLGTLGTPQRILGGRLARAGHASAGAGHHLDEVVVALAREDPLAHLAGVRQAAGRWPCAP